MKKYKVTQNLTHVCPQCGSTKKDYNGSYYYCGGCGYNFRTD